MSILTLSGSAGSGSPASPAAQLQERIRRARLISFDVTTWLAIIRLDGSMSNAEMPVGQWISSNMMTTNAYYAVLLLDDTNPNDGVIIGPYGGLGPVQQPSIANADGTLADLTTKFNTLLGYLDNLGLTA